MVSRTDTDGSPTPAESWPGEANVDVAPIAARARLVLEIEPGERRLLPEFGCRFHQLTSLRSGAERRLAAALAEEALERWSPGLGVERVEVDGVKDGLIELRLWSGGAWHRLAVSHRAASPGSLGAGPGRNGGTIGEAGET